jgi:hypothetical protein
MLSALGSSRRSAARTHGAECVRYAELLHVLRAAADHLGQADFLVIGSASVLATHREEDLPDEATRSDEADLVPSRCSAS